MREKFKVLLAHEEIRECTKIKNILESWGFEVQMIHNVDENIGKTQYTYNILTPDILLLCKDSVKAEKPSLVKSLRKTISAPILLMSAQRDETAIVEALESGAHDYLCLPFGTAEHLARINAAIRNFSIKSSNKGMFEAHGLRINFGSREVNVHGKTVRLTPIEFRIITLLARNAGRVLTHGALINEIWGPYNSDNLVLRVNMANIRKKIEENPNYPKYIFTEAGIGYRMVRPE